MASRAERRRASLDTATPAGSHSSARRRCQWCRDKVEPDPSDKFDVVIIFSKNCTVSLSWVVYLSSVVSNIFSAEDRPMIRVTSRDVESLVNSTVLGLSARTWRRSNYENCTAAEQQEIDQSQQHQRVRRIAKTASLQIVLLSKSLLNHVGLNANDPLGKLIHPKRVLGLFLGIDEDQDMTQLHKSALYSFPTWPKITMLDQAMEPINEFMKLVSEILGRSLPTALFQAKLKPPARFKLTPRKIRPGEEKVTLILLETVEDIQNKSKILIGTDPKDIVCVNSVTWLNPYVVSFAVPKKFLERGIIVKVQLQVDGDVWGFRDLKCQSKLGEISLLLTKSQLVGNPVDLMCQALNISPVDHDAVDAALARNLVKKNIPGSAFRIEFEASDPSDEEFPTLLHFAARFGFSELLWALLECPGSLAAINIRNRQGLNVIQLAEVNGHTDVYSYLTSFSELVDTYCTLSPLAEILNSDKLDAVDYQTVPAPKPFFPPNDPPTSLCSPENVQSPTKKLENQREEQKYLPMAPGYEDNESSTYLNVLNTPAEGNVRNPSDKLQEECNAYMPMASGNGDNDDHTYLNVHPQDKNFNQQQSEEGKECYEYTPMASGNGNNVDLHTYLNVNPSGNGASKEKSYLEMLPGDDDEEGATGTSSTSSVENENIRCTNELKEIVEEFIKTGMINPKQAKLISKIKECSDLKKKKPPSPNFFQRIFSNPKSGSIIPDDECQSHTLDVSSKLPVPRVPSPFNNKSGWSSDRSSVTSQLSHDSGAHSDSPEERKVQANLHNHDYDIPPPKEASLRFANYLVPPPPRPVENQVLLSETPNASPRPPRGVPLRPPCPYRYPFEILSVEHEESTVDKASTHEDLGRILPSEEPDVMMQMPILPQLMKNSNEASSSSAETRNNELFELDSNSPAYMDMGYGNSYVNIPKREKQVPARKALLLSRQPVAAEIGEYLALDQVNLPTESASMRAKQDLNRNWSKKSPTYANSSLLGRENNRPSTSGIRPPTKRKPTTATVALKAAPEKPPTVAQRQLPAEGSSRSPSPLPRLIPPRVLPRTVPKNP